MPAVTIMLVVSAAWAVPQGFTTDLEKASQECQETGKLIYAYFHLDN